MYMHRRGARRGCRLSSPTMHACSAGASAREEDCIHGPGLRPMELSAVGWALQAAGALPSSEELLWRAVPALCAGVGVAAAAAAIWLFLPVEFKWVWSQETDLYTFVMPVCIAFSFLPSYLWVEESTVPFWAYVPLVVVGDLMHIWATLLRTYLDTDARQQRSQLFFYTPPVLLVLGFAIHKYSPVLHASVLSYVAIYHFVSQVRNASPSEDSVVS